MPTEHDISMFSVKEDNVCYHTCIPTPLLRSAHHTGIHTMLLPAPPWWKTDVPSLPHRWVQTSARWRCAPGCCAVDIAKPGRCFGTLRRVSFERLSPSLSIHPYRRRGGRPPLTRAVPRLLFMTLWRCSDIFHYNTRTPTTTAALCASFAYVRAHTYRSTPTR